MGPGMWLCSSSPAECQNPLFFHTWGKVPGSSPLVLGGEFKFNASHLWLQENQPPSRGFCSGLVQGTEGRRNSNSDSTLTLCSGEEAESGWLLLSSPWAVATLGPATSLRWALPFWVGGSASLHWNTIVHCRHHRGRMGRRWDLLGLTRARAQEHQSNSTLSW